MAKWPLWRIRIGRRVAEFDIRLDSAEAAIDQAMQEPVALELSDEEIVVEVHEVEEGPDGTT